MIIQIYLEIRMEEYRFSLQAQGSAFALQAERREEIRHSAVSGQQVHGRSCFSLVKNTIITLLMLLLHCTLSDCVLENWLCTYCGPLVPGPSWVARVPCVALQRNKNKV